MLLRNCLLAVLAVAMLVAIDPSLCTIKGSTKKAFLILDNLRAHHSKPVKELRLVKAVSRHLHSVQKQSERVRRHFQHASAKYAA